MSILERFASGDRVALAKIISFVEDRREGYENVLAQIYSGGKIAYRVGLTGPPGAGKSSLVNRIAVSLSDQGLRVGVIAVDPSSPFSGGALLGDRVRMQALYGRPNIFVRSMATRGSSGGLAASTKDVCVVLEGFGFDIILVETVGVGQIELDVASVCDSVVVVFVPESGDAIQAMKSGLMEIANIFCLNKSDRPGAERIKAELESILDVYKQVRATSRKRSLPEWETPVVPTVATNGTGIAELWAAVSQHRQYRSQADPAGYRADRARSDLVLSLLELAHIQLEQTLLDTQHLDRAVEQIICGQADPYTMARRLFESWRREH
jgi:LAO/AO transport system kinase